MNASLHFTRLFHWCSKPQQPSPSCSMWAIRIWKVNTFQQVDGRVSRSFWILSFTHHKEAKTRRGKQGTGVITSMLQFGYQRMVALLVLLLSNCSNHLVAVLYLKLLTIFPVTGPLPLCRSTFPWGLHRQWWLHRDCRVLWEPLWHLKGSCAGCSGQWEDLHSGHWRTGG